MTQYIYLASPMKLAVGEFGSNPVSPEQPNVFNSEYDFTHLYFENNYDSELKQRFTFSKHFSYKHQVATASNYLPFKKQESGTREEKKCLTILYEYIEKAIQYSNVIEVLSSLNGREDEALLKRSSVSWSDIKNPYDLVLEDRELLEITHWS